MSASSTGDLEAERMGQKDAIFMTSLLKIHIDHSDLKKHKNKMEIKQVKKNVNLKFLNKSK